MKPREGIQPWSGFPWSVRDVPDFSAWGFLCLNEMKNLFLRVLWYTASPAEVCEPIRTTDATCPRCLRGSIPVRSRASQRWLLTGSNRSSVTISLPCSPVWVPDSRCRTNAESSGFTRGAREIRVPVCTSARVRRLSRNRGLLAGGFPASLFW